MFLIRSAELRDFSSILKLARVLDSYNLPADPKTLKALLLASQRSFKGKVREPEKRKFLFVAEEIRTQRIVGCSLIIGRHGTPRLPHLSFDLGREIKTSRTLGKRVEHITLRLHADPFGYTEIGGLVVLPRYRRRPEKIGKQLSYARFAYMAAHRRYFRRKVLVEYLPKLDHLTGNRLWRAVAQKFTHLTYHEADRLSATNKEFILSLFPRERIYCDLLPDRVLKDLQNPSVGAEASRKMLVRIGFRFLRQIDPFDGGPHYGARLSRISLIQRTKIHRWSGRAGNGALSSKAIVMVEKKTGVRSVVGGYRIEQARLVVSKEAVRSLGIKKGDPVFVTPFDL